MEDQVNGAVVDLSAALPEAESTLDIVVPGTNKRTGWRITFAGPAHPKTVAQNEELSRASLNRAERMEAQQFNGRKVKPEGKQPADVRRENVAWVLGRIVEWTPIKMAAFRGGELVELPRDATAEQIARAHELLAQPFMGPYFTQMVDFLNDQASFIPASATN